MKTIAMILVVSFLTSACATVQPVSCQETCAARGMVCGGESYGTTVGYGSAYSGSYSAYGNSFGASYGTTCERAKTDTENSEVDRLRGPASEKIEANASATKKNLWIASGVYLVTIGAVVLLALQMSKSSYTSPTYMTPGARGLGH